MKIEQYVKSPEFDKVKAVIDHMPVVILLLDNDGVVYYENNKAKTMSGLLKLKNSDALLRYGDYIHCRYAYEKNHRCGNNYFCDFCELHHSFGIASTEPKTVEFVREVMRFDEPVIKWFRATVIPVESFKLLFLEEKEVTE